jgi:hypothetical protein
MHHTARPMSETFFTVSTTPLPKRALVPTLLAGTLIWSVVLPLFVLHAWVWVYQEIYFGLYDIPKLRQKDFVTFDRNELKGLDIVQKLACAYCAYGNGTVAWLKAVINRTEVYSCAIKHRTIVQGNEHQADFYPYEDFA